MSLIFSYVKYSEASFPMTGQYTALLLITTIIWVLLWFGYRQNKINDEIKKKEKEDRKDERTKIQATQQSELIDQRKTGKPPKNFESTSNDILSGDFSLGSFDPR